MRNTVPAPHRIYSDPDPRTGVRTLLYPEGAPVPADRADELFGKGQRKPAAKRAGKKPAAKRAKAGPVEDRAGRPDGKRPVDSTGTPVPDEVIDSPQEEHDG